jgi:hypothetical protein
VLATIVATNVNAAQLMFLIAVIVAAIVVVVGIAQHDWAYFGVLWAVILLFIALGLLFST